VETSWKNGSQGHEVVAQASLLALFILWQYINCWDYVEANEKNDRRVMKEMVVDYFLYVLSYSGYLETPEMGQVSFDYHLNVSYVLVLS
jgi:hypothetical protein